MLYHVLIVLLRLLTYLWSRISAYGYNTTGRANINVERTCAGSEMFLPGGNPPGYAAMQSLMTFEQSG